MSPNQKVYSSVRKAATRNERRKFSRRNFLKTTLAGSAVAATAAPALGDGSALPHQPHAGAQRDTELEKMLRKYGSEFGNKRRVM